MLKLLFSYALTNYNSLFRIVIYDFLTFENRGSSLVVKDSIKIVNVKSISFCYFLFISFDVFITFLLTNKTSRVIFDPPRQKDSSKI